MMELDKFSIKELVLLSQLIDDELDDRSSEDVQQEEARLQKQVEIIQEKRSIKLKQLNKLSQEKQKLEVELAALQREIEVIDRRILSLPYKKTAAFCE